MNMDKNLIAERFSKAIGTYTREANIPVSYTHLTLPTKA